MVFLNKKSIFEGYIGDSFFSAAKPLVDLYLKNDPALYNLVKATPLLFFGLKASANAYQAAKNTDEDWSALFIKEGGNFLAGIFLSRFLMDGLIQDAAGFNPHLGLKMGIYMLQLAIASYEYYTNYAGQPAPSQLHK